MTFARGQMDGELFTGLQKLCTLYRLVFVFFNEKKLTCNLLLPVSVDRLI